MSATLEWPGYKGKYTYWFVETSNSTKAESGNYMFVKLTNSGWVPVYVGIADNLKIRLTNHEREAEAVKAGATHVMGHTNPNKSARENEEADLILYWQPPLNTQLKKPKTVLSR